MTSNNSNFDLNKDLWNCSHDSLGYMVFEGKIINNSTSNFRYVKLRGTVFDSANNIVNTDWSYIDSDILYANSSSTFSIYVKDPNGTGKSCKVIIEDYDDY